jgi:starvation-inducible DNA-binding protein
MQQTHNTLSENIRAKSTELLNKHLAATIDLRGQVKQAHWNVRGQAFIALHQLFDEFGQSARQAIDDAAAYGDPGTADLFTELSRGIDHQLWVVEAHLPGK